MSSLSISFGVISKPGSFSANNIERQKPPGVSTSQSHSFFGGIWKSAYPRAPTKIMLETFP